MKMYAIYPRKSVYAKQVYQDTSTIKKLKNVSNSIMVVVCQTEIILKH